MKELQLTTEELSTLVWALNSKLNQERMRCIEEEKPYNETVKRLSDMCGRAYQLLTQALEEETKRPTQFIVEWDDHEGNRHEMTFDNQEDAQLEAARLKERFDYVAIIAEIEV